MATVLGLAMRITADASGLARTLTPAERSLQRLGEIASSSSRLFDAFLSSTTGASAAQRQFATDVAFLTSELRRGLRTPQEFAAEFERLQVAARETADAFAEGQRLSNQYATAQERQAAALQRLDELFQLGAIGIDTYNRAASDAIGVNDRAAQAERERAAAIARAAQITESVLTPMQRYDQEVTELRQHLDAARISEETFNRAVEQATQRFIRAESAAKGYDVAVQGAGTKGNLAFNELAGTLAILPGPIGNVAGRLSGISSAAEGLNRIFSNGGGIGQFGTALAGLINPATLALGAVAAFGAGAVAVGRGLVQLEGEVERLTQLADRLGVSFDFIQVLEVAASQTGSSIDSLGTSFTKFLRSLDDARDGGRAAAEAFVELGISAEEVRGSNPESLFTRAADAIAKMEDPAKRAATAVALFGKSGAELLPVFRQLGQAALDIERIGGSLTDQQQADVLAFGDALDRVGVASQGFKRQITAAFADFGQTVADSTAESIGALNRFIKSLDDTANDKTWLGFQKSAERLRADREILASREQINKTAEEGRANRAIAELVASLGLAADGSIQLNGELAKAQNKAADFGDAGTRVFFGFVKTLEDIAAAADGAGLSQEQLDAAVKNAGDAFEKQLELLGREKDAQKAAADAATKAADQRVRAAQRLAEIDRQRADAFIENNGLIQSVNVAEDLLAITRQIDEAETAIVEARAAGDRDAEASAIRRLRLLDQAQASAQDTLDLGFNANDIQEAIRRGRDEIDVIIERAGEFGQAGVQAALKFQDAISGARKKLEDADGGLLDPKSFDAIVAKERQIFDDRIAKLEEIRNLELELVNEKADLEERRLQDIMTVRAQPLQLADVRTTEGQRQFLAAAGAAEDEAIAEYRRGRQAIERLEKKIEAAKKVELK